MLTGGYHSVRPTPKGELAGEAFFIGENMNNKPSKLSQHCNRKKPSGTYMSWRAMKTRCNNPNTQYFHVYGGRGITYDQHWESFENFLNDMGVRPEGTTLDRIDNDGNYCKENCRWATVKEQNSNTSKSTLVDYEGKKVTISELSRLTGICRMVLQKRHAKNQELLKPVKQYNRKQPPKEPKQ